MRFQESQKSYNISCWFHDNSIKLIDQIPIGCNSQAQNCRYPLEGINMMKAPRFRFLDFARGMAIVFMILQHSVVMYEAGGGEYSITEQVIYFLGTALKIFGLIG